MILSANKSSYIKNESLAGMIPWLIFILYLIIASITITHHELWGDELHSWNIAKGSQTFSDLISNTRYEGHPPLWYSILWIASKFTHNVVVIQWIQFVIASFAMFLLIFFSPLPLVIKAITPFGYYFLFEYGVFSRNYGICALLAFCLCVVLLSDSKRKLAAYYILLFLLSNTHLLGLILAISFHFYFLLLLRRKQNTLKIQLTQLILGLIILLPALYFIFPPADSGLNTDFWINRWNVGRLTGLRQPLLYAFLPMPAWWEYHFWNSEFIVQLSNGNLLFKLASVIIFFGILLVIFISLRLSRGALLVFFGNLFLLLIVSIFLPLNQPRQAGFIFIGFIIAVWIYCNELTLDKLSKSIIFLLLIIQLTAAVFSLVKEIQLPFSNAYKVKEFLRSIPKDEKLVSDYWTVNVVSAYEDQPVYCLETGRELSFLLWNRELATAIKQPNLYSNGLEKYFKRDSVVKIYLISIHSPQLISEKDSSLFKTYNVELTKKAEGAIEKWSNLYLYKISKR